MRPMRTPRSDSKFGLLYLGVALLAGCNGAEFAADDADAGAEISCVRSGCSAQLCVSSADEPIATTCEWREEYACYDTATCEVQANGVCGWSPSSELSACLEVAGGETGDATNPADSAPAEPDPPPDTSAGLEPAPDVPPTDVPSDGAVPPEPVPPQADPTEPAQTACVVGGCSGQLCVAEGIEVATTCEWLEEYACYKEETCELQESGQCGWTMTKSLKACLVAAETTPPVVTDGPCANAECGDLCAPTCGTADQPCLVAAAFCNEKGQCTTELPQCTGVVKPIDDTCVVGGCSGQLCVPAGVATDLVTTCEWQEEYACYKSAKCETQASGGCGWTPTDELLECLDSGASTR